MLRGIERRRVPLPECGVEIALIDWGGDGPLALLHHANGFCAALWDPVAERLRGSYRVVAMDARGAGDSSAPADGDAYLWEHFADDLVAVAEHEAKHLGRARVDFGIGHSFGGTGMAVAAAKRPDLFGRIAMVDPVIPPPPETIGTLPADRPPLAELARKRRPVWPSRAELLALWRREGHAFSSWDPRAQELYAREGFRDLPDGRVALKCDPRVEAAVFERNASIDAFAFAPRIRAPLLILWASRGTFPRPLYERFVAGVKDARIEDIDTGHLAPMEAPDLVAERLLAFGADGD